MPLLLSPALWAVAATLVLAAAQPPCTTSSYGSIYTDCDPTTLTRSRSWYTKENCAGGVPQPANLYGIPCSCDPGFQRLDDGSCSEVR